MQGRDWIAMQLDPQRASKDDLSLAVRDLQALVRSLRDQLEAAQPVPKPLRGPGFFRRLLRKVFSL
jgi:hypothetical protein